MGARSTSSEGSGPGGCYGLAGLVIESELPLPELLPANHATAPDVSVRVCRELPTPANLVALVEGWSVGPDTVLFDVPGTGRYLVRAGAEILVAVEPQANPSSIRLFLLGSAFGALFHQRGLLPLHAGGVVTGSGCCAFGGDSGAGKSTLTAYLRKRGYRSLADDVLVVERAQAQVWALPGYPQTKLWADTAGVLGIDTTGCQPVDQLRDKYYVAIDREASFCSEPQPLRRLYVLAERDAAPGIERLDGAEALAEFTRNTYRAFLLQPMGRLAAHFADCAALAREVEVFRLHRRRDLGEMAAVLDLLEAHLSELHA